MPTSLPKKDFMVGVVDPPATAEARFPPTFRVYKIQFYWSNQAVKQCIIAYQYIEKH